MSFPIKKLIFSNSNKVPIDQFISAALYNKEHGYYMTRIPFGKCGDFITAPEISQLFGEIIAIWILSYLENAGVTEKFSLVELGPGRGTLMSDILRTLKQFPKYYKLLSVNLIEISPILRETQRRFLKDIDLDITWRDGVADLPEGPIVLVANEFFDSLPVKQFIFRDGVWLERYVLYGDGSLSITDESCDFTYAHAVSERAIVEECIFSRAILGSIEEVMVKHGGAGVIIDYGYLNPTHKSSIQALKNHEYCNFLENVGECDITAHVDFGFLQRSLKKLESRVITQKEFLYKFGIKERMEFLARNSTTAQELELKNAFLRLTENMGTLFKVMLFGNRQLAGEVV